MKITIDTKHDSTEDIRKVIGILKHIVGDEALVNDSFSTPIVKTEASVSVEKEFSPQDDMFSMFGNHEKLPTTNISEMVEKKEEPEENESKIEIISY